MVVYHYWRLKMKWASRFSAWVKVSGLSGLLAAILFLTSCQAETEWMWTPPPAVESLAPVKTFEHLSEVDAGPVTSGVYEGDHLGLETFFHSYGISVSIDPPKDDRASLIRLRWSREPLLPVLHRVAGQLSSQHEVVQRPGGVWFVGVPGDSDRIARVYRVSSEQGSEFLEAIKTAGSLDGRISAVGDTIVVKDTVASIRVIDQVYAELMGVRRQWLVEVRFVELTRRGATRIGVDWSVAGTAVLDASASISGGAFGALAALDIEGLLQAEENTSDVHLVSHARLHVVEGEDATLQVGETVPVPRRSVSPEGTSRTEVFEFIDTGIILRVSVRQVAGGFVRVAMSPEISEVSGFVDEAPIVSRRVIESAAVMQPGGVVVLGGLTDTLHSKERVAGIPFLERLGPLSGLENKKNDDRRLYVVLRLVEAMGVNADVSN